MDRILSDLTNFILNIYNEKKKQFRLNEPMREGGKVICSSLKTLIISDKCHRNSKSGFKYVFILYYGDFFFFMEMEGWLRERT